ncbi:MAG TPA: rod shape-determining protein RodA [Longimicrobiales bacterium]|nr:rod shape-determining protein RodA [Longimicrobiales bacterium]
MTLFQRVRSSFSDPLLALLVLGLSLFGVAMIYSAGQLDVPDPRVSGAWKMQLTWLGLSVVALLIVTRIQVRWLEWAAVPAYVSSVALLMATLVIGKGMGTAAGTKSWIDLGPVMFQPSQFANLATVLMLARVMGSWREAPRSIWGLWSPVLIVAIPMVLVMLQPDLGTAMVFGALLIATIYWAGVPIGMLIMLLSPVVGLFLAFHDWLFTIYIVALIAFLYFYRAYLSESVAVIGANLAAGAIAVPLWNSMAPYQRARILVFLDPSVDPRGAGWHLIQSRVAVGSGGLFGKGFTLGTQKRLAFLPEQHTDFIFSVIGEEFGFVGTIAVLATFAMILWRLVRIAERIPDPFAGIAVFGIFGVWFAHVVVNIGMTVGVMPITGIPLPFLSYGGSFLLASYLALGLVQRMAAEQGKV